MQTEMGKVLQVQRLVLDKNPKSSDALAEVQLRCLGWVWEKAQAFMETPEHKMRSHFTIAAFAFQLMCILVGNLIHMF